MIVVIAIKKAERRERKGDREDLEKEADIVKEGATVKVINFI